MTSHEKSLYAEEMSTPAGRRSLVAARAAAQVMNLLELAKAQSGMAQKDLAEALGVTEGRVSQVMTGDGNVHVATMARFLDAMGVKLTLSATTNEGRVLRRSRRSSPRSADTMIRTPLFVEWATSEGVTRSEASLLHDHGLEVLSVSAVPPSWRTSASAGAYQDDAVRAIDAETRSTPTP
jgi:transcriptional regulator with XRE-family HTH domain